MKGATMDAAYLFIGLIFFSLTSSIIERNFSRVKP